MRSRSLTPRDPNSEVSAYVRARVAHAGRTVDDLASEAGRDHMWVRRRLSGEVHWRVNDLVVMAITLHEPVITFMAGVARAADQAHERMSKGAAWRV